MSVTLSMTTSITMSAPSPTFCALGSMRTTVSGPGPAVGVAGGVGEGTVDVWVGV